MAASSVAQKLQIKGGNRVAIISVPGDYGEIVGNLPEGITLSEGTAGEFDVVHGFFTMHAELADRLEELKRAMGTSGILWISYPKTSAKVETDLNRDILRRYLGENGLRAISLISIDNKWSAMRLKKIS